MSLLDQMGDPKFNIFAQGQVKRTVKKDSDQVTGKNYFEEGLKVLIESEFGMSAKKFGVFLEGRLYRPSLSKDIQDQMENRKAKVCEIYFEGKYLCDVSEDMHPDKALGTIHSALFNFLNKKLK